MTATFSPVYELWDVEAGNLIADYADEAAALDAVREGVDDEGIAPWLAVALVLVEPDGKRDSLARGMSLLSRALAGPNGTIRIGGVTVEPEKVREGLALLGFLASPEFHRAVADLRDALARALSGMTPDVDAARVAATVLAKTTGVPLRVDAGGTGVSLVTPNKAMAELLAVGVPYGHKQRDMPIRAVPDGYAVDVAA